MELNKIKIRLLNSATIPIEVKKQIVASLRPIQLKIEDILLFSSRADQIEDNVGLSDTEENDVPVDPIEET